MTKFPGKTEPFWLFVCAMAGLFTGGLSQASSVEKFEALLGNDYKHRNYILEGEGTGQWMYSNDAEFAIKDPKKFLEFLKDLDGKFLTASDNSIKPLLSSPPAKESKATAFATLKSHATQLGKTFVTQTQRSESVLDYVKAVLKSLPRSPHEGTDFKTLEANLKALRAWKPEAHSENIIPASPELYQQFLFACNEVIANIQHRAERREFAAEDWRNIQSLLQLSRLLLLSESGIEEALAREDFVPRPLTLQRLSDLSAEVERMAHKLKGALLTLFGDHNRLLEFGELPITEIAKGFQNIEPRGDYATAKLTHTSEIHVRTEPRFCIVEVGDHNGNFYGSRDGGGLLSWMSLRNMGSFPQSAEDKKLPFVPAEGLSFNMDNNLIGRTRVLLGFLGHVENKNLVDRLRSCLQAKKKIFVLGHGQDGVVAEVLASLLTYEARHALAQGGGHDLQPPSPVRSFALAPLNGYSEAGLETILSTLGGGLMRFVWEADPVSKAPYPGASTQWRDQPELKVPALSNVNEDKSFFRTATREGHSLKDNYVPNLFDRSGLRFYSDLSTLYQVLLVEKDLVDGLLKAVIGRINSLIEDHHTRSGDEQAERASELDQIDQIFEVIGEELREIWMAKSKYISLKELDSLAEKDPDERLKERIEHLVELRKLYGGKQVPSLLAAFRALDREYRLDQAQLAERARTKDIFGDEVLQKTPLEEIARNVHLYPDLYEQRSGAVYKTVSLALEVSHTVEFGRLKELSEIVVQHKPIIGEMSMEDRDKAFKRRIEAFNKNLLAADAAGLFLGSKAWKTTSKGATGSTYFIKDENRILGVFKSRSGDQVRDLTQYFKGLFGQASVLSDYPGAQAINEFVAFELAVQMGLEQLVPIAVDTALHQGGRLIQGTFMEFISPAYQDGARSLAVGNLKTSGDGFMAESEEGVFFKQQAFYFDFYIGNLDRHLDNIFFKNPRIVDARYPAPMMFIDNANIFPKQAPPSTSQANIYAWASSLKSACDRPNVEGVNQWLKETFRGKADPLAFLTSRVDTLKKDSREYLSQEALSYLQLRATVLACFAVKAGDPNFQKDFRLTQFSNLKTTTDVKRFLKEKCQ